MKMIKELKSLYKKVGYEFEVSGNACFGNLYSSIGNMDNGKPDFIIAIRDAFGTEEDVINTLQLMQEGNSKCNQFKIIYLKGFDAKLAEFSVKTVSVMDVSYFDRIQYAIDNNHPYIELSEINRRTSIAKHIELKENKKACVVQATGTGKTSVCAEILLKFDAEEVSSILYLAPSRYILNQVRQSRLLAGRNVTYMTYAKFSEDYDNEKINSCDFVVLDEFHRCGALKWGAAIKNALGSTLFKYVLGLSATPVRLLDYSRDMSVELFGKKEESSLPISKAIAYGLLPAPIYYSGAYSIVTNANTYKERVCGAGDICVRTKLMNELEDILKNYSSLIEEHLSGFIRKHSKEVNNKYIVFCKNKEHVLSSLSMVTRWFKNAGIPNMKTYAVYSNNIESNECQIDDFADEEENAILFCIDMLSEGISFKKPITGCIFLRNTQSNIVYWQQLGRCLRAGYTHTPFIMDLVDNSSNIIARSVVDEINEEINIASKVLHRVGLKSSVLSIELIDDLPLLSQMFQELENLNYVDSWTDRIQELKHFVAEHGHSCVGTKSGSLGIWCSNVRKNYKQNKLTKDQIQELNNLSFVWDIQATQWVEALEQYKTEALSGEDYSTKVKNFIHAQKQAFSKGKLSDGKLAMLTEVGFDFSKKRKTKSIIDKNVALKLVLRYVEENDCIPKNNDVVEGVSIGKWLRGIKHRGAEEVILERLCSKDIIKSFLNDKTKVSSKEVFEYNLACLVESIESRDFSKYPREWVTKQRAKIKSNKISEDALAKLNPYIDYIENRLTAKSPQFN